MSFLTAMVTLIEKIPNSFWGVVAGSFFSLSGVVLSNRNSARNLRAQLAHDQIQKSREREMSLRREVYLGAAEAISAGMMSITRLSDLELSIKEATALYTEKAPAIAKVNIVACESTLKSIMNFTAHLSVATIRLAAARLEGAALKERLHVVSRQIDGFLERQGRMADLLAEENIAGAKDEHRWNAIQRNFDFESKRIKVASEERATLVSAVGAAQLRLVEQSVEEMKPLNALLSTAIASAREELSLPMDVSVISAALSKNMQVQEASIKEFIARIRGDIAEFKP